MLEVEEVWSEGITALGNDWSVIGLLPRRILLEEVLLRTVV